MIQIKIDIVGGSIAGMSTAIALKENNPSLNVVVHEKHKKIGYNHEGRRCGEAHSIDEEWSKWIPESNSIFNYITRGEVTIGNKKIITDVEENTGFVLNRQEFICQLARRAEKLGAIIKKNDKINSIKELDGNYIIDASGCPSFIKKELGLKKGLIGSSYQQTLENSNFFDPHTLKFFASEKNGYFWIFPRNPKKTEINIGIFLFSDQTHKCKNLLEEFKEENNIKGDVNYISGGSIPVGLNRPFKYNNILFVGDSAVGTFPYTGQGIYRALLSGDVAGTCIAKGKANKYPRIINQMFLKWDLIGKSIILFNKGLTKINPKLVLTTDRYFSSYVQLTH